MGDLLKTHIVTHKEQVQKSSVNIDQPTAIELGRAVSLYLPVMEFTIALSLPICILDDWGRDNEGENAAGRLWRRQVTQLQSCEGWERAEWGV